MEMTSIETSILEGEVIEALRTVYDPEIPVNIYDLGLVYGLDVTGSDVHVRMTLTTPNCPVADQLPKHVEAKLRAIPDIGNLELELVWDPPWDRDRMSDAAKLALGFDLGPPDMVPLSRLGQ